MPGDIPCNIFFDSRHMNMDLTDKPPLAIMRIHIELPGACILYRSNTALISYSIIIAGSNGPVLSQSYPEKPIRMITAGAGGSSDFIARTIAQGLTTSFGHPVIVDNRSAGVVPGQIVSKAQPDGYTLLLYANLLWIGPLLQKTPYDPIKDFTPISLTNSAPNVLVVNPSLPVNSVTELIAYAKARPGALNYGAPGIGGSVHLATELFKAMAGINIVFVPYKTGGALATDLISGQVQLSAGTASTMLPHINSGRLRALAVTSQQPSLFFPGLPTIAGSGLPGYESASMQALFAPANTPLGVINRLNLEVVKIVKSAEIRDKFFKAGQESVGSSPAELTDKIKSEMARMGKVIKDARIRAE